MGRNNNRVGRYSGLNGTNMGTFATANLLQPFGLRFAPDGSLFVVSSGNNSVQRFNGTNGTWLNTVVTNGGGGLSLPVGIEFGTDGNIYVASYNSNKVARFNPTNGNYLGDFVVTNSGGITGPNFMLFRPPIAPVVLPLLAISPANTNVALAWTTNAAGFHLQETTALLSNATWLSVSNTVVVTNGSNVVTVPLDLEDRFFRLIKP